MAKIELNYMLGDEVWFLFPVFEGNVLKGFVPCKGVVCKGVVQDIEISLGGLSFVKYLVRYVSPLLRMPATDRDAILAAVNEEYFDEPQLYSSKEELIEANKDKVIIER